MRVQLYQSPEAFGRDALEVLLRHEVQNNLPIGFIRNDRGMDASDWLLATVKDDFGSVVLTAACTPPFNIVMYETDNQQNDEAVRLLSAELKARGILLPGVLAEQSLARRFAEIHGGKGSFSLHRSMHIMRLDQVAEIQKAPGHCRTLKKEDFFFVPYWERAFGEECGVEFFDISTHIEKLKPRLGKDVHYIWEDGIPVAQAVNARRTEHGAVVNGVYTPPQYRNKGYASSLVAELSQMLLDRGNQFCCLFADAKNPISCGIYRKLGYQDQCVFDELRFVKGE